MAHQTELQHKEYTWSKLQHKRTMSPLRSRTSQFEAGCLGYDELCHWDVRSAGGKMWFRLQPLSSCASLQAFELFTSATLFDVLQLFRGKCVFECMYFLSETKYFISLNSILVK